MYLDLFISTSQTNDSFENNHNNFNYSFLLPTKQNRKQLHPQLLALVFPNLVRLTFLFVLEHFRLNIKQRKQVRIKRFLLSFFVELSWPGVCCRWNSISLTDFSVSYSSIPSHPFRSPSLSLSNYGNDPDSPDDELTGIIEAAESKAAEDLTEEDKMALLGRPKAGDIVRAQLRIKESKEFKVSVIGGFLCALSFRELY